MKITTHKTDNAERRIVAGCLTSPLVCGLLAARWERESLTSKDADRIVGWAIEHWKTHQDVPGKGITLYYEQWAEHASKEQAETTERFLAEVLQSIEQDGEPNGQAVVTLADKHLKKVQLKRMADDVQKAVETGQVSRAEEIVGKGIKAGLSAPEGIDLFCDATAMQSTYAREIVEPLVKYDSGLGEFFGPHLRRDCFVAFMGMEKAGKSYWQLDIAWRAMLARKRVAYIQVGDLSQDQTKDRFLVRASGRPSWSSRSDNGWPCMVKIPTAIHAPKGDDSATVEFSEKEFKRPLQAGSDWHTKIMEAVQQQTRSRRSFFKLFWFPTKTVTIQQVKGILTALEQQDWPPDVVALDYIDLLAPTNTRYDKIDQIKYDWEQAGQISKDKHCLVISATQVNAASYTKKTLDRSNFSGNHLKLAEVDGMVAISMIAEEKERQVCRLSWAIRRQGQYNPRRCCSVAQCLALSNPAVKSVYP